MSRACSPTSAARPGAERPAKHSADQLQPDGLCDNGSTTDAEAHGTNYDSEAVAKVIQWADEELAFIISHEDHQKLDIPVVTVRRTDLTKLFKLKSTHFSRQKQRALRYFLGRLGDSDWMKAQKGYSDRAGIAIASDSFNGIAFCRCSQRGRLCKQPDFCPRCNLDIRVDPALTEYEAVFEKVPYWLALVPSSSANPVTVGLHWCIRKDELGRPIKYRHCIPLLNRDPLPRYSADPELGSLLATIAKVPFEFANRLKRAGLIDGAYVAREIDLDFRPYEPVQYELLVDHTALIHGNMLINTRQKPGWALLQEMFKIYFCVCLDLNIPAYADLMGSRLDSQAEINRWISYELKSMPFDRWYNEALTHGCNVEHLNMAFDQTVFSGIKKAFGGVKSPRKFGNMFCQNREYLGTKPPMRISNGNINRWLNDPTFASTHADWESSVIKLLEKRDKRRGRTRRQVDRFDKVM